jgi:hypothetical protein
MMLRALGILVLGVVGLLAAGCTADRGEPARRQAPANVQLETNYRSAAGRIQDAVPRDRLAEYDRAYRNSQRHLMEFEDRKAAAGVAAIGPGEPDFDGETGLFGWRRPDGSFRLALPDGELANLCRALRAQERRMSIEEAVLRNHCGGQ